MNISEFAYELLDQQEELFTLRRRCAQLEDEVAMYRQGVKDQLKMHQETFGNILTAALDPDSYINKRMRKE